MSVAWVAAIGIGVGIFVGGVVVDVVLRRRRERREEAELRAARERGEAQRDHPAGGASP